MLLRQPEMDFDEIEHPNNLVTSWEEDDDVPSQWKLFVDRCMSMDPNCRSDVMEAMRFWEKAWNEIRAGDTG